MAKPELGPKSEKSEFGDRFWSKLAETELNVLIGDAFSLLTRPTEDISEDDPARKRFLNDYEKLLRFEVADIEAELKSHDIPAATVEALMRVVNLALPKPGEDVSRDITVATKCFHRVGPEQFRTMCQRFLWNTLLTKDITEWDKLRLRLKTEGITVSEPEIRVIRALFIKGVVSPVLLAANTVEGTRDWLLRSECPPEMADAMIAAVQSDLMNIRLVHLSKVQDEMQEDVQKRLKSLEEKVDRLLSLAGVPSDPRLAVLPLTPTAPSPPSGRLP